METAFVGGWEWANRIARTLVLLGAIPVVWIADKLGIIHSLLFLFLVFMIPRTFITRGILLWRRKLALDWWRRLGSREGRLFAGQFALRAAFWMLSAAALQAAILPVQFDRVEYVGIMGMVWAAAIVLALMDAFPSATLRVTTFVGFGLATLGLVFQLLLHFSAPGETVDLDPPLRGEWVVLNGGRGSLFNHHYPHREQSHALDLLRAEERTYKGDVAKLESYYAWEQDVIAPADGVIIKVINHVEDGEIGGFNEDVPEGNSVVLRTGNKYVLLAHLKKGSVRVAEGESVKSGQVLGLCGNSGNSYEPHLHIQVQSHANYVDGENRTFPMRFRGMGYLRRNDRPDFGH